MINKKKNKKYINIDKKYSKLLKIINLQKIKKKKIKNILLIKKKKIINKNKNTNKLYKKKKNKKNKIQIKQLLNKKKDKKNCYINIKSGSGGIESQDWSLMILKMYIKWAGKKKFKIKILEKTKGEKIGIKSATILIIGKYAYGYLKNENGIHRLVRQNPHKIKKKIQTSFSSVLIYPENKQKNKITKIIKSEIKINVYKSSKSGGQNANKTESAVRIKHIPTGIITKCINNRSQYKNKLQAIKQLKKKIINKYKKNNIKNKKITNKNKININRGNQVRSYILNKNIIKDYKSNIKTKKTQQILNGNIDIFIKKNLEIDYKNEQIKFNKKHN